MKYRIVTYRDKYAVQKQFRRSLFVKDWLTIDGGLIWGFKTLLFDTVEDAKSFIDSGLNAHQYFLEREKKEINLRLVMEIEK